MKLTPIILILSATTGFAGDKLTVNEVLKKTEETYLKCKTYMDTGHVRTVFMDKNGKQTNVGIKPFSTAFSRPDRFRFEYGKRVGDNVQGRYVVWKDKKEVKTFWELEGEKKPESLGMGLAGATGVSGGSAHTIPRLLIPKVGGRSILAAKNPVLLPDKKDDEGFPCHVVDSDAWGKVWIRKKTFLISKIEKTTEFDNFRTETVTVYKPQMDVRIADDKLKFRLKDKP